MMAKQYESPVVALQEVFSVIMRIRSNSDMPPGEATFRKRVRSAIENAGQDILAMGFSQEEAGRACFAVVAFLDESVIDFLPHRFNGWAANPLRDELFGPGPASAFFDSADRLLAAGDSPGVANLLEVYELCLGLGYASGAGNADAVAARTAIISERIQQIRSAGNLPSWRPPIEAPPPPAPDPLARLLFWCAVGAVAAGAIAFSVFRAILSTAVSRVGT